MHHATEQAPQMSAYYALAAKATGALEIMPGSDEWASWELYFDSVYGRRPAAMGLREKGLCKHFMVPAQWPEWFDGRFSMDGPAKGKGIPWSQDAAIKHVAGKRLADDAMSGGWISSLVDFVREHHRVPRLPEIDEMIDVARAFDERRAEIAAGHHAPAHRVQLMALADGLSSRRANLCKMITDYRDGMSRAPVHYISREEAA